MKPKPNISKLLIATLLLLIATYTMSAFKPVREPVKTLNDSSLYLHSKSVMPYTPHYQVLGSLIGIDRIIKRDNLTPYPELNRIIWYESNNNHLAQNPYSSAYGYCQIILSTRALIEKQIGNIDWQSPGEQLEACEWLYLNHNPSREWAETEYLWK